MIEQPLALFDSHAHLDMLQSRGVDVEPLLSESVSSGLAGILNIAGSTKPGEYDEGIYFADKYPSIWLAMGVHPHAATSLNENNTDKLKHALEHKKVVALGEIGLDYHYNYSPSKEQRKAFIAQLRLAHTFGLPVIIHTREAEQDTLSILKDEGASELGGVIHCFSGGMSLATAALEMGLYLSFSGIVTFPKSTEIQAVATNAPVDTILCETDSPFLSPVPKRGRVNLPKYVEHVIRKIAILRQMDEFEFSKQVLENTYNCFPKIERQK